MDTIQSVFQRILTIKRRMAYRGKVQETESSAQPQGGVCSKGGKKKKKVLIVGGKSVSLLNTLHTKCVFLHVKQFCSSLQTPVGYCHIYSDPGPPEGHS